MPWEQAIYEVNIDYNATYQNLIERPEVHVYEPQDGTMSVKFKKTSWSPTLIFSTGKIQITYNTPEDHKQLKEAIKPLLISLPGEKLNLKMLKRIDLYDKKVSVYNFVKEMRDILYEEKLHEPDLVTSVRADILSKLWDELFEIRSELHSPENQNAQNWEVFRKLRSLVQILPQNLKEELISSVDTFPVLTKEESEKLVKEIKMEIGSQPILTVGGYPFGEDEMQRKERALRLIGIAYEKKVEEIIGKVATALHKALKTS
jgi:hypothetical protein